VRGLAAGRRPPRLLSPASLSRLLAAPCTCQSSEMYPFAAPWQALLHRRSFPASPRQPSLRLLARRNYACGQLAGTCQGARCEAASEPPCAPPQKAKSQRFATIRL
jgi:hypothetical protein